ncbi:hypothetical protein EV122DRAFT_256894, partial [Schizophyllum commune]
LATRVQTLLAQSAECEHMERTLTQVLAQIEERAPILSQQRAEYERVSPEAALLSTQPSWAILERDTLATSNGDDEQKLAKALKDGALLEKNADDLGPQNACLRYPSLPHDIDADDGGIVVGSPANGRSVLSAGTTAVNKTAAMAPAESVDDVIANRLVLFNSVPAIQAQNRRLLPLVRQLGSRVEDAERRWREEAGREQLAAVREAHEAMAEVAKQLEAAGREMEGRSAAGEASRREREALKATPRAVERRPAAEPSSADEKSGLTRLRVYKAEMESDAGRLRDELGAAQNR